MSPSPQQVAYFGGITLAPKDHLCVFHRGRGERDRLVFPFLREGLVSGQPCTFFAAAGERENFADRVTSRAAPVDLALLEVYEPEGGHLRGGEFAPSALLEDMTAWTERRLSAGNSGLARVAGDMSWAEPMLSRTLIDELVQSEVAVTRWVRSRLRVAVCFYDLNLFSGDLIIPMIKAHEKVWMDGALIENPYYLDPDDLDDLDAGARAG